MKCFLFVGAALLAAAAVVPEESVYAVIDPVFHKDLFVVVELDGEDAATLWEVDDEELESVEAASGEVLQPGAFPLEYAAPGARDPLKSGYVEVEEGRALLVFKFRPPTGEVDSIPRFAGTYRGLRGGAEAWVEVPFEELEEGVAWEDETLAEAGFELTRGVREVSLVQVRVKGETFDVDTIEVLAPDAEEPLSEGDTRFEDEGIEYEFDLPADDLEKVTVTVTLESGEAIVLEDVRLGEKYRAVKSDALKKADLSVEVRSAVVYETVARGTGEFDMFRRFRWTDKLGRKIDIWPSSAAHGGGAHITMTCRVPAKLPRGAKLQLGLLVGAEWEDVAFEYEDVPGPGKSRR